MRLYPEKGKWKIGKNGDPVYNSRMEAKEGYLSNKMQEIRNNLKKVIANRSK